MNDEYDAPARAAFLLNDQDVWEFLPSELPNSEDSRQDGPPCGGEQFFNGWRVICAPAELIRDSGPGIGRGLT